jgi:hypothetical protein
MIFLHFYKQFFRMKQNRFWAMTLVVLSLTLISCNQYMEVLPGEYAVPTKGATWRSEGGGVDSVSHLAGTHYIAGPTEDVKVTKVQYAPKVLVADLKIPMKLMQNQEIHVQASLSVMQNPNLGWITVQNFSAWEEKAMTAFRNVLIREIGGKINISLSADKDSTSDHFNDRLRLSGEILEATKKEFTSANPGFEKNFFFVAATVNDVDFPPGIVNSIASVAIEKYKTELAKVEKDYNVLAKTIEAEKEQINMEAFGKESESISNALLEDESFNIISALVESPGTETVVVIPLDSDGRIVWFKEKTGGNATIK